jgi:hypothetical protein
LVSATFSRISLKTVLFLQRLFAVTAVFFIAIATFEVIRITSQGRRLRVSAILESNASYDGFAARLGGYETFKSATGWPTTSHRGFG